MSADENTVAPPSTALLAFWGLEDARVERVPTGLINRTFRLSRGDERYILQLVNPIFTPRVHEDIAAVSAHVAREGRDDLRLPSLVPTRSGALYVEAEGEVWRILTFLEGETIERVDSPDRAREAGRLLARFHRAVSTLDHDFKNRRLGVHDTPKHLAALETALTTHTAHRRFAAVAPLGREILAAAQSLPKMPELPDRIVHGDPKISNLLFERGTGRAVALVDLDTLARMPLPLELGDALRSWCNPSGEDRASPEIALPLFTAAVEGYAEFARGFATAAEVETFVRATQTIMIELAARFAADALNERYFGWDPSRFATRSEHNELRARGQLALARSLGAIRDQAEAIVRSAFGLHRE